jgi:hypothetical protein
VIRKISAKQQQIPGDRQHAHTSEHFHLTNLKHLTLRITVLIGGVEAKSVMPTPRSSVTRKNNGLGSYSSILYKGFLLKPPSVPHVLALLLANWMDRF